MPDPTVLDALRERAGAAAARAHVPYSRRPAGAVLLLADGSWIAGARVENAAYPLTIPAATAAVCAARVAGRAGDVRAVVLSGPFAAGEAASLAALVDAPLTPAGDDALAVADDLPAPADELRLALDAPASAGDRVGVGLAAAAALHAHVPESDFHVGCVVLAADGRLYAGANVEAADWTRGLCAERVALAAVVAAGAGPARRVWLACLRGGGCSPCGACRQVLAELAPDAELVIGRGAGEPSIVGVGDLLPGAFGAAQLRGGPA